MNLQNAHNNPQVLIYTECTHGIDGILCRLQKLVASARDHYQSRVRFAILRSLPERQLQDIGLADSAAQVKAFGRPLDLGPTHRDISRFALLGDETGSL